MTTACYQFGNAELRPQQRRLLVGGQDSRIGARAFDLLLALVERNDRVVAKHELLDFVWPGLVVEENNLQVHISSLRKVLGPQAIATVPGRSYRFTAMLEGHAAPTGTAAPGTAAAAPPASADDDPRDLSNLPPEPPTLYGRDADLASLAALVDSHRLVTVAGAGGIGKTALAQALAQQLRGALADGVWLIELAPLADASLLVATVAGALRVTLGAGAPGEALVKAVARSRMLVVLDNCEGLLDGVAELAAALHRGAPNVRLLVTSQEPLKVAHEQVYRLGPLALPDGAAVDEARRAGAVALFEARAREAQPRFVLDADNVAAVVDICRHLDGIALAIELAAARVPLLGVEGLRARLGERFRVLTGGSRLALRRHQTLAAALEWSHGLLTPDEQAVLRRLGVFSGGFGLESAQQVVADERIDAWAALEHLGALVDKSLVVAETGPVPRYRLLESTRAFALEKLQQAGETEAALRAHAEAMRAVFEASHVDEYRLAMHLRMERYVPDLDNARAALDWSAAPGGDVALHIALAGAIAWVWSRVGGRPEGMRRTWQAMSLIDADTPPALEARLVGAWSAIMEQEAGPQELATDARAVALYRALGNRQGLFTALCEQVITLCRIDRGEAAEQVLREAEQVFETGWPPMLRTRLLMSRYWLLTHQGRGEASIGVMQELLQLAQALGERRLVMTALINLEQSAAAEGHLEESVARGRELLRHLQSLARVLRRGSENYVLLNLSMSLSQLGEVDEALTLARAAYPLYAQADRLLCVLDPFAFLAFQRGWADDAARVLGRADMRHAAGNFRRERVEQRLRDKLLRCLQDTLPADELKRLMVEGEALSDEACVRLALRD